VTDPEDRVRAYVNPIASERPISTPADMPQLDVKCDGLGFYPPHCNHFAIYDDGVFRSQEITSRDHLFRHDQTPIWG
jgi:hypothetical protein